MVTNADEAVQSTMTIRSITEALAKCQNNGHEIGDVYDVTRVSGGHIPTREFIATFKAQCQQDYCGALLRFHAGRFGGEALSTTCAFSEKPTMPPQPIVDVSDFHDYTLNDWRDEIHQYAIDKGWWDTDGTRNFGDLMALLHSEISEAYEEYRNGHQPDERYYNEQKQVIAPNGEEWHKPEGIPSELADLVIRVFDLFGHYGIDMQEVLTEKHIFNLYRPYRHGGKVS